MHQAPLTPSLIEVLQSFGFNAFYCEGCNASARYYLVPKHIPLLDPALKPDIFGKHLFFDSDEVAEMVYGVPFVEFVVRFPAYLRSYYRLNNI